MSVIEGQVRRAIPADPHVATLRDILEQQRSEYLTDGPPPLQVRIDRIDRLVTSILENAEELVAALSADFGNRPRFTSLRADVLSLVPAADHIRDHLSEWVKDEEVPGSAEAGTPAFVQSRPKGVVGVMGPWNFPISLVVQPAIEALAAGNRVMIKVSEVPSRTASVFAEAVASRMLPGEVAVVRGGPQTAASFSSLPFDHLIFTGSPEVGARVAEAAGRNLVPLTLELGGKNPVLIGSDADLEQAARRIAGARLINGGQLCLCPDYVLVPQAQLSEFVALYETEVRSYFPTYADNPGVVSSVDERNFDRVNGLVADAVAKGAQVLRIVPSDELGALPDRATRRIPPTLLLDVTSDMDVASEEIFGPVIVVRAYDDLDEAIAYVNAQPSPLAAYFFGSDGPEFRRFIERTTSGGVTRNDLVLHWGVVGAPSGGVGRSGMGAYSGKAGFDTFSHRRTIAASVRPTGLATFMLAPPQGSADGAITAQLEAALRAYRARLDNR